MKNEEPGFRLRERQGAWWPEPHGSGVRMAPRAPGEGDPGREAGNRAALCVPG